MNRPTSLLIVAFAAVYVIWGSTYLAIKVGLESLPPFLLMGVRSALAGAVLYGWARARGAPAPDAAHWWTGASIGVLLFVGGHGGLAWSQQRVPSGVASLVVATIPIWMTLIDWRRTGGAAPSARVWLGLALGLAGVGLLTEPYDVLGGAPVDSAGVAVLVGASIAWAIGSVHAKHARLPGSAALTAGMGLLAGGAGLLTLAVLTGQIASLPHISARSAAALAYLIIPGSIVAFVAYVWLLKVTTPTRVSTYAYVNPVVALTLGWLLGGEALSPRVLAAAALMLTGVAAIVARPPRRAGTVDRSKQDAACVAAVERRATAASSSSAAPTRRSPSS